MGGQTGAQFNSLVRQTASSFVATANDLARPGEVYLQLQVGVCVDLAGNGNVFADGVNQPIAFGTIAECSVN